VWFDRAHYEDAEHEYQQQLTQRACTGGSTTTGGCTTRTTSASSQSSLASEIAKAREHIQKSLHSDTSDAKLDGALTGRLAALELDNRALRQTTSDLVALVKRLELRVDVLEKVRPSTGAPPAPASASSATAPAPQTNGVEGEEEDDFELFGDEQDEDDEEAERVKQERVKAYEDKKAKKPVLIAKSNIILDVKPWDDETDMAELEKCVRSIVMDGLLWGASKLVPLAYTIKKLQISCVVEDDKVSTEDLEEKITAFEDYIQSVDIAAFNKV